MDLLEDNFSKQKDEVEALSSIYGEDFYIEDMNNRTYVIEINESAKALLEVTFPPDYPNLSPPTYMLRAPWLKGPRRKELCGYLEEIYLENAGESIVYLWVERIRQFMIEEESLTDLVTDNECPLADDLDLDLSRVTIKESEVEKDVKCPEIFSGEIISDRKSHFQPHLAAVQSIAEVKVALKKLLENKKVANAFHNMYAYRFTAKNSTTICQDCDDDGEAHAGGRMLHLLQILDAMNVVVIVSRWYGGIQLGPDRFKHINNATRQILDSCGYIKSKPEEKGKKKKKY